MENFLFYPFILSLKLYESVTQVKIFILFFLFIAFSQSAFSQPLLSHCFSFFKSMPENSEYLKQNLAESHLTDYKKSQAEKRKKIFFDHFLEKIKRKNLTPLETLVFYDLDKKTVHYLQQVGLSSIEDLENLSNDEILFTPHIGFESLFAIREAIFNFLKEKNTGVFKSDQERRKKAEDNRYRAWIKRNYTEMMKREGNENPTALDALSDLGLHQYILNILKNNKISSVEDLDFMSDGELLSIDGIDYEIVDSIRNILLKRFSYSYF